MPEDITGSASAEPAQAPEPVAAPEQAPEPAPAAPEAPEAPEAPAAPETDPEPTEEAHEQEATLSSHELLTAAGAARREAEAIEDAINRSADPAQSIRASSLSSDTIIVPLPKIGDEGPHAVQITKE